MLNKIKIIAQNITGKANKTPVPKVVPSMVRQNCRTTSTSIIVLINNLKLGQNEVNGKPELQKDDILYNTFVEFLEMHSKGQQLPTNKFIEEELEIIFKEKIGLKKIKLLKQKACKNHVIIKISDNKYIYNINRNDSIITL